MDKVIPMCRYVLQATQLLNYVISLTVRLYLYKTNKLRTDVDTGLFSRLCKEPNHIPLRCNEVEKRGETDMRTFIESRLTEAMLRKCHRCNKYFVKEYGCNKMTCTCGATSCYVCRAEDIDYDHFDGSEGRE